MEDINPNIQTLVIKLAKISLAFGLLGILVLYTPIFDLMYGFVYLVMIPVAFLTLLGFISFEAYDVFDITLEELRTRIKAQRAILSTPA